MTHDQACELTRWLGHGCACASRAYLANPLPAADLPVVVEYDPVTDLLVEF